MAFVEKKPIELKDPEVTLHYSRAYGHFSAKIVAYRTSRTGNLEAHTIVLNDLGPVEISCIAGSVREVVDEFQKHAASLDAKLRGEEE